MEKALFEPEIEELDLDDSFDEITSGEKEAEISAPSDKYPEGYQIEELVLDDSYINDESDEKIEIVDVNDDSLQESADEESVDFSAISNLSETSAPIEHYETDVQPEIIEETYVQEEISAQTVKEEIVVPSSEADFQDEDLPIDIDEPEADSPAAFEGELPEENVRIFDEPDAEPEIGSAESETAESEQRSEEITYVETDFLSEDYYDKKKQVKKDKPNEYVEKTYNVFRKISPVLIICAAVLLIVVAVFAVVTVRKGSSQPDKTEFFAERVKSKPVRECDIESINDFFSDYYNARANGLTTTLEGMYDDPSNVLITAEISSIVSEYQNLKVYTMPGINDDEIAAFVYYDLLFNNVETTVPSVDTFYLKYSSIDNTLKICSDMRSDNDKLVYLTLASKTEPIETIIRETDEQLEAALSADKDLRNLYVTMRDIAIVE